ncbi:MAG: ATP-dependent Clp protease adapter ClpS [Thermodesulfovibrionales bacterium]|nr:ATP-dependent Clp protease adapter ClpS [Thermodesulfovibrionales bacterium]
MPGNTRTTEEIKTKDKTKLKRPDLYKVILLNDDYTTMDFVVYILETVFNKKPIEAIQIMLHVHKNGSGLAGIYTKDIAETKINIVHELAQKNEFPLRCIMEKE